MPEATRRGRGEHGPRRGHRVAALLALAATVGAAPPVRAQHQPRGASPGTDPLAQVVQAFDPEAQERRAPDPLQSAAPVAGVHHVIVQLRNALAGWLTAAEREQLDAIDASGTADADAQLLRYLAVDRALRRFAPMALDAAVRSREADRLRALLPVTDARTALSAARCPAVTAALRRRERIAVASAEEFARRLIQRASATETVAAHAEPPTDDRTLAADRAVISASDAASHSDVAQVSEVVWETTVAYGTEADRAVVVAAALDLVRELVATARGAPVVVTTPAPFAAVAFDPLLDPAAAPAAAASAPRARRTRRGRATPSHTPSSSGGDPFSRTVIGACMDDLRCLPM